MQYKAQSARTLVRSLGLAELGNKAELDQLGLELWLNLSGRGEEVAGA